jgi:hypothetical protein
MRKVIRIEQFVITQDHLDNEKLPQAEIDQLKKEGYNQYFKLYDDDDILYYSGYLHEKVEDEFAPLDWGMYDSGCTSIKLRNKKTGKLEVL